MPPWLKMTYLFDPIFRTESFFTREASFVSFFPIRAQYDTMIDTQPLRASAGIGDRQVGGRACERCKTTGVDRAPSLKVRRATARWERDRLLLSKRGRRKEGLARNKSDVCPLPTAHASNIAPRSNQKADMTNSCTYQSLRSVEVEWLIPPKARQFSCNENFWTL